MSATTTPPAPAKKRNRRSLAEEGTLVWAKRVHTALPSMFDDIRRKDAHAKKVRIDEEWNDDYGDMINTAQTLSDERAATIVVQKQATKNERATAEELRALLIDIRDRVEQHLTDNEVAQEAYGRGAKITSRTGALIQVAGNYLQSWEGKFREEALDAGITESEFARIGVLRAALSTDDVAQLGVGATKVTGSITRAGAFKNVRTMTAYAVSVIENVYGKHSPQMKQVADPRPLTNYGASRKAKTKAAKQIKAAADAAKRAAKPKRTAAAVKRRAKRKAVALAAARLAASNKRPAAKKKSPAAKKKKRKDTNE